MCENHADPRQDFAIATAGVAIEIDAVQAQSLNRVSCQSGLSSVNAAQACTRPLDHPTQQSGIKLRGVQAVATR